MKKFAILTLLTAMAVSTPLAPTMAEEVSDDNVRVERDGKHRGGKMFNRMDLNDDGVITKEEFLTKSGEKFDKMDADGNGEVTKDEAKEAHKKMKEKWKAHKDKRGQMDGESKDSE